MTNTAYNKRINTQQKANGQFTVHQQILTIVDASWPSGVSLNGFNNQLPSPRYALRGRLSELVKAGFLERYKNEGDSTTYYRRRVQQNAA